MHFFRDLETFSKDFVGERRRPSVGQGADFKSNSPTCIKVTFFSFGSSSKPAELLYLLALVL